MGARFEDDVRNRELLPKALQLRDMTRLGRKGASKYRDLRSEDTGRWGEHLRRDDRPAAKAAFDSYHVDDRFKSDRERERDGVGGGDRSGPGGANAIPLGERRGDASGGPRDPDRGDRYRDRDRERDHGYRPREDRDRGSYDDRGRTGRDRPRSRSRSPRRRRDDNYYRDGGGGGGRKRDSSREDAGRREGDKRRRIDAR